MESFTLHFVLFLLVLEHMYTYVRSLLESQRVTRYILRTLQHVERTGEMILGQRPRAINDVMCNDLTSLLFSHQVGFYIEDQRDEMVFGFVLQNILPRLARAGHNIAVFQGEILVYTRRR